jgi:uncharacterized protein YkwD
MPLRSHLLSSPWVVACILPAVFTACEERPLAMDHRPDPAIATPSAEAPAGTPIAQDLEEHEMLRLINKHRAVHKLDPLRLEAKLVAAARWLSEDMAARLYFGHTDSLGRNPFQRMDAFDFDQAEWRAENIACGNGAAPKSFGQWLNSPGHNAHMLSPHYTVIGIARAFNADSSYGWYWTTDFGSD